MISPRSNVVSAVLKGVTALALRWEEAVSETRRGFPTCKWAADQNLQLAGTLLFGGDLEKQMNVDQRRSRHCGFSLMLYLVLMRRSNKKKQPNHFDFIIIVVEGPLMSFSCQRRENKYKYFTDTVEYKKPRRRNTRLVLSEVTGGLTDRWREGRRDGSTDWKWGKEIRKQDGKNGAQGKLESKEGRKEGRRVGWKKDRVKDKREGRKETRKKEMNKSILTSPKKEVKLRN